jgi:hypothetical protein
MRQATQHDCLPSLLGNGDKLIEIVYGEENISILYWVAGLCVSEPFHMYSLSPHLPQFQQSAKATPL